MDESGSGSGLAVTYSNPVGEFGASEYFEILSDGESSLTLTSNHDGRPEIGVWRHTLPKERFEDIVRRLDASGYRQLAVASPRMPGEVPTVFGERRQGENEVTKRAFLLTPPELQDATSSLHATMTELRAYPSRVMRGEAHWRKQGRIKGSELEIELMLENSGVLPLQMSNPVHGKATEWSGLRLTFARGNDEQNLDLRPMDLHMAGATSTTLTFRLLPSQKVSFWVRAKIPVGPGKFEVRLQVHGMVPVSSRQTEVLEGMLWLPLGSLKIDPAPVAVR